MGQVSSQGNDEGLEFVGEFGIFDPAGLPWISLIEEEGISWAVAILSTRK